MASLVLVCDDLIFSTKIVGTARAVGRSVTVFANASAVAFDAEANCVIVDLNAAGVSEPELRKIRASFPNSVRLIAYGPHVEFETLRMARRAGADEVLPRSEFSNRLAEILSELPGVNEPSKPAADGE